MAVPLSLETEFEDTTALERCSPRSIFPEEGIRSSLKERIKKTLATWLIPCLADADSSGK
jgi:hypothetical protein